MFVLGFIGFIGFIGCSITCFIQPFPLIHLQFSCSSHFGDFVFLNFLHSISLGSVFCLSNECSDTKLIGAFLTSSISSSIFSTTPTSSGVPSICIGIFSFQLHAAKYKLEFFSQFNTRIVLFEPGRS